MPLRQGPPTPDSYRFTFNINKAMIKGSFHNFVIAFNQVHSGT